MIGPRRRLTTRQRVAAVVLSIVAVAFIGLDLTGSSLQSAHSGVRGALGALYRGADGVLGPARRFVVGLPHAATNAAKVRALRQQVAELDKQVADSRIDRKTSAELNRLQLAANAGGYEVLPARVLATSAAAGFDYTVTLDAGSSSGVRLDQTVIDGAGLVGRVVRADASTCVVMLVIDPGFGVGSRDARTGQLAIATGAGGAGLRLRPLLDTTARLRVGDPIATGPAGKSSFVAGLSVGTVRSVSTSADGSTTATIDPTVSPSGLDLVGIILVGGEPIARAPLTPGNLANGQAHK